MRKNHWNRIARSKVILNGVLCAMLCTCAVATFPAQDDGDENSECSEQPTGKALKLWEKAQNGSKYSRAERVSFLQEAYDRDDNCLECLLEWGRLEFNEIKRSQASFYGAQEPLEALIERCPNYHAEAYYMLGAMAYADRNYEEALDYFESFLFFPDEPVEALGKRFDKQAEEVREVIPNIQFQIDFRQFEDAYVPRPIPSTSLQEDEFLPALSPDGSLLFFTRRGKYKAKGDVVSTEMELFHWSFRNSSGEFMVSEPLDEPFNRGARYGGASISVDNLELYIAALNPAPGHPDNIDLFVARYEVLDRDDDGAFIYIWGALEPLSQINTPDGWEAQPALSADGTELFFSAVNAQSIQDRSGNPTMDIWCSKRDSTGNWSSPQLLPAPINTTFNDKSPFLHPDGRTLYFASDRLPGGGGYDIWICRRDSTGQWQEAQNLGMPLNTEEDEHGMVVSTDGREGFFASRRAGTKGLDILSFPMPPNFQPDDVFLVKGVLTNVDGDIPSDAKLYLQYAQSKEITEIQISNEDGRFASVVRAQDGQDVLLIAEGDGIGFEAQVIYDHESLNSIGDAIDASVVLEQPSNGEPFEIGDIQFETNSSEVNRTSLLMLEIFAGYLQRNQTIGVHIMGHTDNRGKPEDNLRLSQLRSESVARSLVQFGVEADQITHEGFGQSRPIASNESEEGRARNRRTEFEVRLRN